MLLDMRNPNLWPELLEALKTFVSIHCYSPSDGELAALLGWPLRVTKARVAALVRRGVLRRNPYEQRTLRIARQLTA